MVIWSLNLWCVIPLTLLLAGQWACALPAGTIISLLNFSFYSPFQLSTSAVVIKAIYHPQIGCIETHILSTVISASYIYIIFVDFAGLCFCAWKLLRPMRMKSRLSTFLFRDGMAYFVTA